jgi:hypothetical protein
MLTRQRHTWGCRNTTLDQERRKVWKGKEREKQEQNKKQNKSKTKSKTKKQKIKTKN